MPTKKQQDAIDANALADAEARQAETDRLAANLVPGPDRPAYVPPTTDTGAYAPTPPQAQAPTFGHPSDKWVWYVLHEGPRTGESRPALVVRENPGETVNLLVFTDAQGDNLPATVHRANVQLGQPGERGKFHAPD